MNVHELLKEEYLALRKEVEYAVTELRTLERYCLIAVAAIYTWLATEGQKVPPLAWNIPIFLTVFCALRSWNVGNIYVVLVRISRRSNWSFRVKISMPKAGSIFIVKRRKTKSEQQ